MDPKSKGNYTTSGCKQTKTLNAGCMLYRNYNLSTFTHYLNSTELGVCVFLLNIFLPAFSYHSLSIPLTLLSPENITLPAITWFMHLFTGLSSVSGPHPLKHCSSITHMTGVHIRLSIIFMERMHICTGIIHVDKHLTEQINIKKECFYPGKTRWMENWENSFKSKRHDSPLAKQQLLCPGNPTTLGTGPRPPRIPT